MKHDIELLKQLLSKLETFKRYNNWLDNIYGTIIIEKHKLNIALESSDFVDDNNVLKATLWLKCNERYYFFIEDDKQFSNIVYFENSSRFTIYNNGEWLC